jgi:hypothetical protein
MELYDEVSENKSNAQLLWFTMKSIPAAGTPVD